jgi:spore coat polysaccharide biosynthesis predicted glycosyltransferase SpsG
MKILFSAEGDKKTGMGAFYNCATIAWGFRRSLSPHIKFFISKDSERGVESGVLDGFDAERIDMRNDTAGLIDRINRFCPDIIIQDLLAPKRGYSQAVGQSGATIADIVHIPDRARAVNADVTVNLLYRSGTRCLYGPAYAILDEKFARTKNKKIRDAAKDILVAFGGSDANNLTLKVIRMLDHIGSGLRVDVVLGPGFRDYRKVAEKIGRLSGRNVFKLRKNVGDMRTLMLKADLAFVSGGRVICELAAAGTPGIAFAQNELEYGRLRRFEKWGSVLNCGYYKNLDHIRGRIKRIMKDKRLRENMSASGRRLVDGRGVDRIIEAVLRIRDEKNKGRR